MKPLGDGPIVERVRKVRAKMDEECGHDLDRYIEMIKKAEKESGRKFVHLRPKKTKHQAPA